jgi:hypothetical protein
VTWIVLVKTQRQQEALTPLQRGLPVAGLAEPQRAGLN